jgi:hypothetical protein
MASLENKYFKKGVTSEQNLLQGLTTECIQIHGMTMYYLPRKLNKLDNIFGEDTLSSFEVSLPIEIYIENFNQFDGNQEFISKFGLELQKQMVLLMSVDRWKTEVKKIKDNMWVTSRPQEGDLIYVPLTRSLLEIKFVDHDDVFWQLNMNYRYKLVCELFRYNQETINTGIPEIDVTAPLDLLNFQINDEDGDHILQENGSSLIQNDTEDGNQRKDNSDKFTKEAFNLEFDINNPFGD